MMFLVLLSGSTERSVLKHFYWFEADTKKYPGAKFEKTRWTCYNTCDGSSGSNKNCSKTKAAYPFSPKDNFSNSKNLPSTFLKHRKTYYYLSRIGWALLLVGLALLLAFLFVSICSICVGLQPFLALILGLSLFFTLAAACLITAAFVKGRNAFRNDGSKTHLGVKMFGLLWGSVAALLFSFLTTCGSCMYGLTKKKRNTAKDSESVDYYNNREAAPIPAGETANTGAPAKPGTGGIKFFKISRKEKPVQEDFATSEEHDSADDRTAVKEVSDTTPYLHNKENFVNAI
ncbi:unnamed protein product [Kuraishia capsulata CBS 1993]|uniref:SUR7 family protein FMP45 n=1 Tax=Kuraishia capsulata CBS 1993 TaxID=1382522 RepID=W6MWA2_9ASCO|nr:uncharacterized protein KUCA_T00003067001 [Kuraishia capsulata CBS 1993]CDK27090.1 unnamed protein product [Kuraishia capsulata CBS 1993]